MSSEHARIGGGSFDASGWTLSMNMFNFTSNVAPNPQVFSLPYYRAVASVK